ncbi:hypothetical protein [Cupriavidus basilensis]|uniref:hypothetical protein n=1 Tax=Cupriavidus basilensis TaxID=68895 RepID=UPI0023E88550|nr:hypothetical protein [Cupriavidus basilensis]MDF3885089.1 hypothetical protein [Cupriavidus basilensis]
MSTIRRSLFEDVFAVFERACHEKEFELADDILLAIENLARRRKDVQQIDLAYLLLAASCEEGDLPQNTPSSCDGESGPPVVKTVKERLVFLPYRTEGYGTDEADKQ